MKVYFDSVGCRLNQAEIELMAQQFRAAGHEVVAHPSEADLVVVNTCTVTAAAASDSRARIRQAQQLGVKRIAVTGCWASMAPDEASQLPGVTDVITNSEKSFLGKRILGENNSYDLEPLERIPLPGIHRRTRAFIKVQDGCDNHCTFCVTRIARGKSVSVPADQVLEEVQLAEKGGTQEIVLSGVHLGSWGQDFKEKQQLSDLIKYLLQNTTVPRMRLSSIEPWNLDDEFFSRWSDERMCPHFHLPLQSGSAATLKRMARHTTPEKFTALVEKIRMFVPNAAITTDLIVGFPGESEEEFNESLQLVKTLAFAGGHVFRYSAREGTSASQLPQRVNGKIAHARSQIMRSVLAESEQNYRSKFIQQEVLVLWESASRVGTFGWQMHGLTGNYLPITSRSNKDIWNKISRVKITGLEGESLQGEIIE